MPSVVTPDGETEGPLVPDDLWSMYVEFRADEIRPLVSKCQIATALMGTVILIVYTLGLIQHPVDLGIAVGMAVFVVSLWIATYVVGYTAWGKRNVESLVVFCSVTGSVCLSCVLTPVLVQWLFVQHRDCVAMQNASVVQCDGIWRGESKSLIQYMLMMWLYVFPTPCIALSRSVTIKRFVLV